MSTETDQQPAGCNRILRGRGADVARGLDFVELPPGAPRTPVEVERAVEAALAAGRLRGHEVGYQAGLEAAAHDLRVEAELRTQAVAAAVAALESASAQLASASRDAAAQVVTLATSLALEIAEAILARELTVATSPGADAIRRALVVAPRGRAVARLNPADAATITGDGPGALAGTDHIEIVADANVERGGCLLDVGPCRIDAALTPALQRVRELLA